LDRSPDGEALNADFTASVDCGDRIDGFGIEALAGKIMDDAQCFFRSMCVLVGAVGSQGIESISYGNHARQQRYQLRLMPP